MRRQRFHEDQSSLFGYISPVTGDIAVHPPLCACGKCPMPVERFEPQPAAVIAETVPESWEVEA
jgi:hypothetical protein